MVDCKAKGCNNTSDTTRFVKGYCLIHYRRLDRKGNLFSKRDPNEVIQRKSYAKIVLRNEKSEIVGYAKVDKDDISKVAPYRWHLDCCGYVYSDKIGMMHRLILDAEKDDYVDHIKTGIIHRSDNRRNNIRLCTQSQNLKNIEISKANKSGHKGVSWDSLNNKWVVRIKLNGKYKNLGRYSILEEAAKAYIQAAKQHHEEFFNSSTMRNKNEH